jgi:hypothetical protein
MRSTKRATGIGSDGLAPGEALFEPAGEAGEGEAEDEIDHGNKLMGYLRHFAVTREKENKNTMSARTGITLTQHLAPHSRK